MTLVQNNKLLLPRTGVKLVEIPVVMVIIRLIILSAFIHKKVDG